MSSSVIDLKDVSKKYKRVLALDHVNFKVPRNKVFGLLGPNGAGKSTLVKIITSLINPTTAQGEVLSFPIGDPRARANIGYLPENPQFPTYLTGRQALRYYGALNFLNRETVDERATFWIKRMGLSEAYDRKVSTYSKGMNQKLGLIQSLLHKPELVILDEPTDGLDPLSRHEFREVIKEIHQNGMTVLMNSHLLNELESVCHEIAILVNGKIKRQGSIQEMVAVNSFYEIKISPNQGEWHQRIVPRLPKINFLKNQPYPIKGQLMDDISLEINESSLSIGSIASEDIQELIDILRSEKIIIESIQKIKSSLEDVFIETVNQ